MTAFDFDQPQFSTKELLECVPGLNPETFQQWKKRHELTLSVGDEIGRGKRVQHTGTDVVQVATRYVLIPHGQFVAKFPFIWPVIKGRIIARQTGLIAIEPGPISTLFFLHPETGELHMNSFSEAEGVNFAAMGDPTIPTLQLMFGVDRFIDRMVEQMQHVKSGTKAATPPTARQPLPEGFEYDAAGNVVLCGLTVLETQHYARMEKFLDEDGNFPSEDDRTEFYNMFVPLDRKHALAKSEKVIDKVYESEEDDFFRRWVKNENGNSVLVGLTQAENDEFRKLRVQDWAERTTKCSTIWETTDEQQTAQKRYLDLHDKHETARQKRLGEEFKQRTTEENSKRMTGEGSKSAWKFWK